MPGVFCYFFLYCPKIACYELGMWDTKPTTKPNNASRVCPKHGCAMTLLLVSYVCDECNPPGTVKQAVEVVKKSAVESSATKFIFTVSSNPKADVDGYTAYSDLNSAATRAKSHASSKGKNYYVFKVEVPGDYSSSKIRLTKAKSKPVVEATLTP